MFEAARAAATAAQVADRDATAVRLFVERPTMTTATAPRTDFYEEITNAITRQLEAGVPPWTPSWRDSGRGIARPLRWNGEPYRGVNILALWSVAWQRGFMSPYWMTFRQVQEEGGRVRKGEHGTRVIAITVKTTTELDENGDEVETDVGYVRHYTVFCADQCDGLPTRFGSTAEVRARPIPERLAYAQRFFVAIPANIRRAGDRAFYSPVFDMIQMPPAVSFRDAESYAATLGHELIHWTGHRSRLDRKLLDHPFGTPGYAKEELVAELGAAFLCADLRITPEVREDHASYIGEWLTILKNDKRAIAVAASRATKAVDFLYSAKAAYDPETKACRPSR